MMKFYCKWKTLKRSSSCHSLLITPRLRIIIIERKLIGDMSGTIHQLVELWNLRLLVMVLVERLLFLQSLLNHSAPTQWLLPNVHLILSNSRAMKRRWILHRKLKSSISLHTIIIFRSWMLSIRKNLYHQEVNLRLQLILSI